MRLRRLGAAAGLAVGVWVCAALAAVPPAFKQDGDTQASTADPDGGELSVSVFLTDPVEAGDLIYVAMTYSPATATMDPVTDNFGDTYHLLFDPQPAVNGWGFAVAIAFASQTGQLQINYNFHGVYTVGLHQLVYSGVNPDFPVDRTQLTSSTTDSNVDGGRLRTRADGETVITFVVPAGNIASMPTAWNVRSTLFGDWVADQSGPAGDFTPIAIADTPEWTAATAAFLPVGVTPNLDAGSDAGVEFTVDGGFLPSKLAVNLGCSATGGSAMGLAALVALFALGRRLRARS